MVAAFPVAKLGALVLKQLSKPIATFCKERAKSSPIFRKYVCMPPAQFYNWCEVKSKMWILNLGKPVNIPVLNEAMAIDLGANLLGEGILFLIAAAILVAEYNRSSRKEEKKEQLIKNERDALSNQLRDLYFSHEKQAMQIRELTRLVYDLENRMVQKPWVPKQEIKLDDLKIPSEADDKLETEESNYKISNENKLALQNCGLIMTAVYELENDLWKPSDIKRAPSLVTLGINYLYKDVYRLPITL